MAAFPRGPYIFQIPYIVSGFTHKFELNCDVIGAVSPGDAPDIVELRTKGEGPMALDDCAAELWTVLRTIFSTTTLASVYSLYKTNELNTDLEFITGGTLTIANGSNVATPALAQQGIFTLRSAGGHIAKIQVMETPIALNTRGPLGSLSGEALAIRNYALGSSSFIAARDRSFLIAPLNESWSQNEALSRKRFRQ